MFYTLIPAMIAESGGVSAIFFYEQHAQAGYDDMQV